MTFTSTYIDMMKESPVQKERKFLSFGDWYAVQSGGGFPPIIRMMSRAGGNGWKSSSTIWLPTSDDWVDLFAESEVKIFKKLGKAIHLIWRLRNWTLMEECHCKTLSELLSHFWHYEKGLIWNGTNWKERKVCI
jgi:hypothetical protein